MWGLLVAAQGAPEAADGALRLEAGPAPDWVWVHQPVELSLGLELEPDARLLPLTNRALDLPLVLGGAWFDLPEGL
ncbi:MAG: hypothetical protein AAFZ65_12050, partial [Planctomycetota bacterium]